MQHSPEFTALCADAKNRVTEISPETVCALLKEDNCPTLIDVRETAEFTAGHLPDAKHLSRGIIEIHIHRLIQKDEPVILYCGGGNRSLLAADNLKKMGYTQVQSMSEGFRGWVERRFETVSE